MKEKFLTLFILFTFLASCSHKVVTNTESGNKVLNSNVTSEYFLSDTEYRGNTQVPNFSKAKSLLKKMNYFGITEEIYCGCEFLDGKIPQDAKCGIKARKNPNRAFRIEFEHIVPFENQAGHTIIWKNGVPDCNGKKGRKCASMILGHLEGDLWNLWPSAGELNADRSNYPFTMISGPRDQYGKCDFKVENGKAEPRDSVKSLVAFTYMYFQKTYAKFLKTNYISNENEKLFAAWAKFPLTQEQCNWAKHVVEIQGNRNDDLLKACGQR